MARQGWRKKRSVIIGAVVVLMFACSVWVAVTATSGLPGQAKTVVRAAFENVGALRSGDDVRIAGVRVGRVGDIRVEGDQAVAELQFDGECEIYRNAHAVTASVGARSALGEKFVDFTPGSQDAGTLRPGETIPSTKTTGAQELADVLAVLDEPTRRALGSTVREVGGGSGGHSGDLRDALAALPGELPALGNVAKALSTNDGADLTRTLQAIDALAGRFDGRQQQISQLVGQLDTTLAAVAVDDGKPLGDALTQAPDTLKQVRGALQSLQAPLADTQAAMSALRPGADALGAATPDVRGVLREAVQPLDKLPGFDQKAEPAVGELTHVLSDARPLAPRLTTALENAHTPLSVLAPYSPEVARFFSYAADALHEGDAAGNWLRIYLLFNSESVDGAIAGVKDPITARDPYPAPGQAGKQTKNTLFGPRAQK
jgi:phospholipid/cholesterol/gamma-HCH transport system substrate-binding protein